MSQNPTLLPYDPEIEKTLKAQKKQNHQERQLDTEMTEHHEVAVENLEQNVDQGNVGHIGVGQVLNHE